MRYWRFSQERMQKLIARRSHLLAEAPERCRNTNAIWTKCQAAPVQDLWDDISPINSQADENASATRRRNLKPTRSHHRASSERRRCGARSVLRLRHDHRAAAEAQAPMDRHRHHAPCHRPHRASAPRRLRRRHQKTYEVIGEPVSVADAAALAASDPYQFQWWALGLVGARPPKGRKARTKASTAGSISTKATLAQTKQIILSVKAGKLHAPYVRDLRGVMDREKAAIGVLLTLDEPTKAMRTEAASAGFYKSPWGKHPQLPDRHSGRTAGRQAARHAAMRQTSVTYKRAPKAASKAAERPQFEFGEPEMVAGATPDDIKRKKPRSK